MPAEVDLGACDRCREPMVAAPGEIRTGDFYCPSCAHRYELEVRHGVPFVEERDHDLSDRDCARADYRDLCL